MTLSLNGKKVEVDADPNMPLLWALRDVLGMTGTKFGCGMSLCGACTVLANGEPIRSCQTPLSSAANMELTTIEGLHSTLGSKVQAAWEKWSVPQCGYCQSGQVLAATALLTKNPHPTDADIDAALQGNICRCGTYNTIRAAIHHVAKELKG